MLKASSCLVTVFILSTSVRISSGHGRLLEPPARSSLWRFPDQFPEAEPNYDDNALNCGGRSYQHLSVNGKCGICGDKWISNAVQPRPHEAGGRYAKGIIARHYPQAAVINVTIEVTASHKGYFEFRVCPNNNVTRPATQECLNEHLLRLENGSTKFYYGSTTGFYHMRVRLPDNITCSQCVFQWKWTTGNSWGVSPSGEGCVGCGPQEEFYGCSDISIGDASGMPSTNTILNDPEFEANKGDQAAVTKTTTQQEAWTTASVPKMKPSSCHPSEEYKSIPGMDNWCVDHCAKGDCPKSHCVCPGSEQSAETAEQPAKQLHTKPTEQPDKQPAVQCQAVGVFAGDAAMENWCAVNCGRGFCPETHCTCGIEEPRTVVCKAVGAWKAVSGMAQWCQINCQLGYCPASHCLCG